MNLAVKKSKAYPSIVDVVVKKNTISAIMSDGREVSIPTAWFSRLLSASKDDFKDFEISPGGYGIHWPKLDEDISIKAFLD